MPQNKNRGKIAAQIEEVENDLRDLINWIKVKNTEEIESGEGKKVEDDVAEDLIKKIKVIATKLGIATL